MYNINYSIELLQNKRFMGNHFTPPRFIIVSIVLVWLCCPFVKQGSASTANCSSMERNALIDFKQNLLDPSSRLFSWIGHNCCEWHGITCDTISGKVTKIDLWNSKGSTILQSPDQDLDYFLQFKHSSLGGHISSSLLHLHNLSYLDLSYNCFEGASIPYFFAMLKNLRYLSLSGAYFGGEIPSHLGNLSNLNYLDLSMYYGSSTYDEKSFANRLHVRNLNWLSSLSSLEYLDLGGLNLSSTHKNWVNIVNKLSSLTELHMGYCDISLYSSTAGLQNLTSLRVLQLSENDLTVSLPLWLFNLTTLIQLDLSGCSLQGTISPDFVKLRNLRHLDLRGNVLTNIGNHKPFFLLNLCKLQFANLAYNNFGGKLDELLGSSSNCTHNDLESLDLAESDLEGEIPNSLGILDKLQYLDLQANNLWGSLPNSIGNLTSLQYLKLSTNSFNGTIPPSFGQLLELVSFQSYANSWKGVMTEAHLVNLTKLKVLAITRDIHAEAFVFNVSYNWIPSFRLKTLHLRNCFVGPCFPIWLQVQTKLIDEVIISYAGISDFLSKEWISHVSSQIRLLDLSNNLLEGNLSQLLVSHTHLVNRNHNLHGGYLYPLKYPNLRLLLLQNNLLSGTIPDNISDSMPKLVKLILSKNHLNGKIDPSCLEKLSTLSILSLSHNHFFGELSDDWGKLKSLKIIDLANNNIYGKIPSSMGLLTDIRQLVLNNNNFFGEIPKSLQNCLNIESIDFSGNRLHGSLPEWIGISNSNLKLLNLRSNFFNGTIPRQWCNFPLLRVLDLSNNNLVGHVPSCLSNWITFIYGDNIRRLPDYYDLTYDINDSPYFEKTTLVMKGRELEYETTLRYVLTIDLSRNKLSGEIPNEITEFILLGSLNLSNNELVGVIPENIGAMQKLETLDLSCNNLSGKIPTSLGSLNFLSHLNLSFNNLTGTIPTSNHLQTLEDPSIYEGNPFLHTSSQRKMPSDENTNSIHVSTSEADTEEKDYEMFSFFVSMAIGFPIGLNILFFTIFTSESRRVSYFCFVDHISHNILEKVGILANYFRKKRS